MSPRSLRERLGRAGLGVLFLMGMGSGSGCGGSASAENADRSMKQYELAIGLRSEGNEPGAFQTLYKALELDPNNAKAHLLLANMFLVARDDNPTEYDAKAEQHLKEVLRIQESDAALQENSIKPDAYNGLGVLYIHQGRYDEAESVLRKAVDDLFNREAYMAWGNLGWLYNKRGEPDKAIDALLRAVRQSPRFCVGYYRLGEAYLAKEDPEKAEQALTSALEADERCAAFQDAWQLRGEARMKLGHREDARADFERCVELGAKTTAGGACTRYLEATY